MVAEARWLIPSVTDGSGGHRCHQCYWELQMDDPRPSCGAAACACGRLEESEGVFAGRGCVRRGKWDFGEEPTSNARCPCDSWSNSQESPVLLLCLDDGSSLLCNPQIFPSGPAGPKLSENASISGWDVSNPWGSQEGQILIRYQILQRKLSHWFNALGFFTSSQEFYLISSVNQTVHLKSFNFLSERRIF